MIKDYAKFYIGLTEFQTIMVEFLVRCGNPDNGNVVEQLIYEIKETDDPVTLLKLGEEVLNIILTEMKRGR